MRYHAILSLALACCFTGGPDIIHALQDLGATIKYRTDARTGNSEVVGVALGPPRLPAGENPFAVVGQHAPTDGPVTEQVWEQICGFDNIESIEIFDRHCVGIDMRHLGRLRRLNKLDLSFNKSIDIKLDSLQRSDRTMRVLILRGANVDDSEMMHLRRLSNITRLDFSYNDISDFGLACLAGLSAIESLELSQTRVTDAGLTHLGKLSRLRILDLSQTRVTDAGLTHLGKLSGLQILDLSQTYITDTGLAVLAGITELRELRLREDKISDHGLIKLATLGRLRLLDLRRTDVTQDAVAVLQKTLPSCRLLYGHDVFSSEMFGKKPGTGKRDPKKKGT